VRQQAFHHRRSRRQTGQKTAGSVPTRVHLQALRRHEGRRTRGVPYPGAKREKIAARSASAQRATGGRTGNGHDPGARRRTVIENVHAQGASERRTENDHGQGRRNGPDLDSRRDAQNVGRDLREKSQGRNADIVRGIGHAQGADGPGRDRSPSERDVLVRALVEEESARVAAQTVVTEVEIKIGIEIKTLIAAKTVEKAVGIVTLAAIEIEIVERIGTAMIGSEMAVSGKGVAKIGREKAHEVGPPNL